MKKYFVQDSMELIENKPTKTIYYELDIPKIYGFDYMKKLDQEIIDLFDDIGDYLNPILFVIKGEFDLLEAADVEDKISFIIGVVSIFTANMIKKGTSTGRGRFAAPITLDNMNVSSLVKRDLVNRQIRFPIFRLEVVNENGNSVYEVM